MKQVVPRYFIHDTVGNNTVVSNCGLHVYEYLLTLGFCTEHVHFKHGHSVQCQLVHRDCPVQKIVYTSKDCKKPYIVVIFQGHHSHPPWPEEKPTQEAKDDLKRCLDALGISGATADRLDNGRVL